jgi:hypothetical protein
MKAVKRKSRNQVGNETMESFFRVATSHTLPDMENLRTSGNVLPSLKICPKIFFFPLTIIIFVP